MGAGEPLHRPTPGAFLSHMIFSPLLSPLFPVPVCSNLVYMGMGEPLHNLPGMLPSIETVCQPLGLHVSYNKVRQCGLGLAGRFGKVWQLTGHALIGIAHT